MNYNTTVDSIQDLEFHFYARYLINTRMLAAQSPSYQQLYVRMLLLIASDIYNVPVRPYAMPVPPYDMQDYSPLCVLRWLASCMLNKYTYADAWAHTMLLMVSPEDYANDVQSGRLHVVERIGVFDNMAPELMVGEYADIMSAMLKAYTHRFVLGAESAYYVGGITFEGDEHLSCAFNTAVGREYRVLVYDKDVFRKDHVISNMTTSFERTVVHDRTMAVARWYMDLRKRAMSSCDVDNATITQYEEAHVDDPEA